MKENKLVVKWVNALRSGKFSRTTSQLYNVYEDAYCCLGVADKVCFDADFIGGVDDLGHGSYLPDVRMRRLNLQLEVKPFEREKVYAQFGISLDPGNRQGCLANLNDAGYGFDTIANVIELLGWDKEVVNG